MKSKMGIAPKLVKCPVCNGTGIQKVESTTISPGKPDVKEVTEMPCMLCKGKKKVTLQTVQELKEEEELWCKCLNPPEDVEFHADFTCDDCEKHHYHCGACGKICQVG